MVNISLNSTEKLTESWIQFERLSDNYHIYISLKVAKIIVI